MVSLAGEPPRRLGRVDDREEFDVALGWMHAAHCLRPDTSTQQRRQLACARHEHTPPGSCRRDVEQAALSVLGLGIGAHPASGAPAGPTDRTLSSDEDRARVAAALADEETAG